MAHAVTGSDFANQYPEHGEYSHAVGKMVDAVMHAGTPDGVSRFVQLICNDPHFPGILARYSSLAEYIPEGRVTVLSEEPTAATSICFDCLALSQGERAPSRETDAASADEVVEFPAFATLYPTEKAYVQAVVAHAEALQAELEEDKLASLMGQIQNDPHFRATVAHSPWIMKFMRPIEDASLIILALSKLVGFLKIESGTVSAEQREEEAAAAYAADSDSDSDSDCGAPVGSPGQLAEYIAEFYGIVAVRHAANPEVIAAAFAARKECGFSPNNYSDPIFTAVGELLEKNGESRLNDPAIAKQLVNCFPCAFVGLPPHLQQDIDLVCHVLPENPFLYFLLSPSLQQNRRIAEIVVKQGLSTALQHHPDLIFPEPSMERLEEAKAMFRRSLIYCDLSQPPIFYSLDQLGLLDTLHQLVEEGYQDLLTLIFKLRGQEGANLFTLSAIEQEIQEWHDGILGNYQECEQRALEDDETDLSGFGKPVSEMTIAERVAYRHQVMSVTPLRRVDES